MPFGHITSHGCRYIYTFLLASLNHKYLWAVPCRSLIDVLGKCFVFSIAAGTTECNLIWSRFKNILRLQINRLILPLTGDFFFVIRTMFGNEECLVMKTWNLMIIMTTIPISIHPTSKRLQRIYLSINSMTQNNRNKTETIEINLIFDGTVSFEY